MNETLLYIIKVNLILSLCVLFYWFLLRNEKFFTLNRFFLLGAIAFAFLLPLLPGTMLPGIKEKIMQPLHEPLSEVNWLQSPVESETYIPAGKQLAPLSATPKQNTGSGLSFFPIAAIIYMAIVLCFLTRFVLQLVQLSRLLKGNETKKEGGIVYHRTEKPLPPFSFFRHLIINKAQSEKEIEQIIAHERVHIRQLHMVDILLASLVQIVFWINPFIWIMNRLIRLNLEYLADEEVLKGGADRRSYQVNILTTCMNPIEFELANLFSSSKIKLRIQMMNANKSPLSHLCKYALMLPFLLASYFLINPASAQTAVRKKNKTENRASSSGADQMPPVQSFEGTDKENQEATPLIRAALRGDLKLVRLLVDRGADVNEAVPSDGSPLIAAAGNGHAQIVSFLVEKGADVNKAVLGDGNPLIAASMNGHAQIVTFLVEKGADVNAIVPRDETPLINAAGQGHLDIVKYLVSKGAKVNLAVMANEDTDPELRSPLNQAIKYGHKDVVSFLLENGARK